MNKGNNYEVSLIIPTFNKADRLKITLLSIAQLKYIEEYEVIIVNDGSTDNTIEVINEIFNENFAKRINYNVITTQNLGRAHARNVGIQNASGELLVFSDDDLILDSEFILNHKRKHKNRDNLVVHGKILNLPFLKFLKDPFTGELYDGSFADGQILSKLLQPEMFFSDAIKVYLKNNARIGKFEKDIANLYSKTSSGDGYVRWIGFVGGNSSIKKKNMIDFDNNFGKEWGCEDLEVGFRLYKKGMYFDFCNEAINYHMSHFRPDFMKIHNNALTYFYQMHKEISIRLLYSYFNNEISSLVEWKNEVDKSKT